MSIASVPGSSPPKKRGRAIEHAYARLIEKCKTQNDANRIHIALENRLTPLELASICSSSHIPERLDVRGNVSAWQRRMQSWIKKCGSPALQAYERTRISPNIVLYSRGHGQRAKALVVAFTGVAHRLLLPTAVVLQSMSIDSHDVLLLKDPTRRAYKVGIPDVPGGFSQLSRLIENLASEGRYSSVVTFGVSGGGLPALALASQAGFDKGVSVAGGGRTSPGSSIFLDVIQLADRDNRTLNLLAIYGADRRQDREAALSLTDIPGLQALGIKCGDSAIGHNPLYPLLLTGSLAAFLQTALNPHVAGFSEDAMRASCVQGEYTQQRPSP